MSMRCHWRGMCRCTLLSLIKWNVHYVLCAYCASVYGFAPHNVHFSWGARRQTSILRLKQINEKWNVIKLLKWNAAVASMHYINIHIIIELLFVCTTQKCAVYFGHEIVNIEIDSSKRRSFAFLFTFLWCDKDERASEYWPSLIAARQPHICILALSCILHIER